jgi:hypothetical protein
LIQPGGTNSLLGNVVLNKDGEAVSEVKSKLKKLTKRKKRRTVEAVL